MSLIITHIQDYELKSYQLMLLLQETNVLLNELDFHESYVPCINALADTLQIN